MSGARGGSRTPAPPRKPARTPYAILGVLALAPMSGVDIQRWLDQRIGNFWRESSGQLYPTLAALQAEGAVRPVNSEPTGKRGRPTTVYAITAHGRQQLARWLAEPATTAPPRNELLLKLFFASDAPDVVSGLLDDCRSEQREKLARYSAIEQELDRLAETHATDAARFRATVRYGIAVASAVLAWTDEAESLLHTVDDAS